MCDTYEEDEGWHRRQVADVDQGNGSGKVSVSGANEK